MGAVAALSVSLAAGCGTIQGPKYERPEMPEKAQWSQLEGRELTASEVIRPDWWTEFGDPELNDLIKKAVDQGLDVKIAALRLDKAGIELGRDRLAMTPELTLSPADSVTRAKQAGSNAETTRETETLGLGLSWELDVWGKIRKSLQAADAGYRATEMDWRATYLALVANVAERYFQVRLFDEQIAQQAAAKQQAENLLQIYYAQYAEGMVPETRIRSQKAEIAGITTQLLEMQRGRAEAELKLGTLLGMPAGDFKSPASGGLRERVRLINVPDVLPADTLAQRPDVLRS
jgi:NodT family efflux transporter outer membrane factor (OMF) lipoprotein